MKATCLIACGCDVAEGPIWWQNHLWWLDINPGILHRCGADGAEHRQWQLGGTTGCIVPSEGDDFLAAGSDGLVHIRLRDDGTVLRTQVSDPEADRPDTRFNDGRVGPDGRLWAGSMSIRDERGRGALYRFADDGSWTKLLDGLSISNGIAFSADDQYCYHIDTPTGLIRRYRIDERGNLVDSTDLYRAPEDGGLPDGCCIDHDGHLWVAFWDGGCLRHIDGRTGRLLDTIALPLRRPTSCCFGGADGRRLFITSAGRDDPHPDAGGICAIDLPVGGPLTTALTRRY
ncbi:MAG: SMP-30/gluconolactonase/LRE family protein [Planctomycetota bacterium]